MIHLPKLDPHTAYIGTSLFLPLKYVYPKPIRSALTFGFGDDGEPRVLVREHAAHLEVPRGFLTEAEVRKLGINRVVDLRPTVFETTTLRPKKGFALRPSQIEAWSHFEKATGGIFNAPCGSGKSLLGIYKLAQRQVPALIVAPQKAHLQNWEHELRTWFDLDGPVGWIGDGKFEYDREVVFATVQGLAKRAKDGKLPADFHKRFGITLFDEVHHLSAKHFVLSADLCGGERYGLTATVKRIDKTEGAFMAHIGPVFHTDVQQQMIATVEVIETGIQYPNGEPPREVVDIMGEMHWGKLYNWLGSLQKRNDIIGRELQKDLKDKRVVYALSHSVDQIQSLSAKWKGGCLTGDTPADVRLVQLNDYNPVFATMGVGTEAYNRPALDTLYLMTPFFAHSHAAPAFHQASGRVLRPVPGKPDPIIKIFMDDIAECKGAVMSLVREAKKAGFHIKEGTWNKRHRNPKGF